MIFKLFRNNLAILTFISIGLIIFFVISCGGGGSASNSDDTISTDDTAITKTETDIEYFVSVIDPKNHEMTIELTIENLNQEEIVLARAVAFLPALPPILNMSIEDDQGTDLSYQVQDPFQFNQPKSQLLIISCKQKSKIIISYSVDLSYNSFSPHWCLTEEGGIFESQICFFQPQNLKIKSAKMLFNLPSNWEVASRFTNNGNIFYINTDDLVHHDQEKFFIWSAIAFGNFNIVEENLTNAAVKIAVQSDLEYLQNQIEEVAVSTLQYGESTIGDLTVTSNLKLMYAYLPDNSINQNWPAYARDHILGNFQSGISEDDIKTSYRGIAHSVFHTFFSHYELDLWNTIRLDPEESTIQFFTIKSLKESTLWDQNRMHQELIGWYNDYKNYISGTSYDVPLYPESNRNDFPNEPTGGYYWYYGIQNKITYEQEPLVLWILDTVMRDLTDDNKGFENVWAYFYANNPGTEQSPLGYNDILEAVNLVSGFNFTNFFDSYISGNVPLPLFVEDELLIVDKSLLPLIPPI